MNRYFFQVDNDEAPIALFKLEQPFTPKVWSKGEWVPSDSLINYLRDGFIDLEEVSEDEAKKLKPEAFNSN